MAPVVRESLEHVVWLGGPSELGTSAIAQILVARLRWQWYPCDLHEHNHLVARADPRRHPAIYRNLGRTPEEVWEDTNPEELFDNLLETSEERFPMIVEDLLTMPAMPPILVDGSRLFPSLVGPLMTGSSQAIWLLPTADFAKVSQEERTKARDQDQVGEPNEYRASLLARERLIWDHIRGELKARGLPSIEVDGQRSPEQIANEVQAHFEGGP